MSKDYYEILGISKTATQDDIKKAYRKLAREHHPDMVKDGDKAKAEQKFKEISAAYQVLSDPEKRKMYDQYGHAGPNMGGSQGYGGFNGNYNQWGNFYSGGENPFGDVDPFDIFETFFGGGFGPRRQRKGKDLHYEMHIEFKDAVFGLEKEVSVDSGKVKIKIPAGILHGSEMKFQEKGMPGPNGLPNGDLYIKILYKTPKEFQIIQGTLLIQKEIDFVLATLGGEVDITTIDTSKSDGLGKTKLKVPAGTQYGTKFLIKGKGMPRLHSTGQGDVVVQVAIVTPKSLNKKQKQLLEEFQKSWFYK